MNDFSKQPTPAQEDQPDSNAAPTQATPAQPAPAQPTPAQEDQPDSNAASTQATPAQPATAPAQATPTGGTSHPLFDLLPLTPDHKLIPIDPEDALMRYSSWVQSQGITLWPHQEEALLDLASNEHVILGTPTGSGKSLVAVGMCYFACTQNKTIYYTAPIKALVSEKFFYLVKLFGKDLVGMITGDCVINSEAPIICCTAEILAQDALRWETDSDIKLVCMDEFHYFGDKDRGWAWQVPLLVLKDTQFLLMSATLGDTTALAQKLKSLTQRDVSTITNAPRPVPLSYSYSTLSLEASVELIMQQRGVPVYIVCFAQSEAQKSAAALASFGISNKEEREEIKKELAGFNFSTAYGKELKRLLLCGVGVHHAGMLPRYRLLVERLAQKGLLPVICGTDTLGVGINVPIHTVVLRALAKYDGRRMRILNSREFHQITGRAGRSGFDTEGVVVSLATPYEIERLRARAKAANDPKKLKRIKVPKPPEGYVGWSEHTFQKLIESEPEALTPRLKITHAMVLAEVMHGGAAYARLHALIKNSFQTAEEQQKLIHACQEIFATLMDAGVIVREEGTGTDAQPGDDTASDQPAAGTTSDTAATQPAGDTNAATAAVQPTATTADDTWENASYALAKDIPSDFALDQMLAPFVIAACELIDRESPNYALDIVSLVEASLENPPQIMKALVKEAKNKALAEMKMEGIDYEERMERLENVSYEKPLKELIDAAYTRYCAEVPWAKDFQLYPKSIVRAMLESANDFKGYVQKISISRSEGTLLRYLSDAWRVLAKTIPQEFINDDLERIISWLHMLIRTTDSSLLDEWEMDSLTAKAPQTPRVGPAQIIEDPHGLEIMIHNALFKRVLLASKNDSAALGKLDEPFGFYERKWRSVLDEFFEAHESLYINQDARSKRYFSVDTREEKTQHLWHAHISFLDAEGDIDFGISADVDLDATKTAGEVIFMHYRAGAIEDLMETDEQ